MTTEPMIPEVPQGRTQPSHRAPMKIYWVDLITIGHLRYRQNGGGKFTRKAEALGRITELSRHGIKAELFEGDITWKKVE